MSVSPISAFISYAKADQAKAQEIADSLEQRGIKCWIAPRDVRPGRTYGDEIIRGIEGARALILVLSSASNDSGFVSREIERAVSKNKPIFTIRIEDVLPSPALELFISSTQWIDAFSGRLGPQIDRLAQLLAEDEAPGSAAPAPRAGPKQPQRPAWRSPLALGVGAAVLVALVGALAVYLMREPDDTDYMVLARSCERLDGDAAVAACDRAISSRKLAGSELAKLYAARGYQRQMKFDIEGALSDYREAIKLGSTDSYVFNNRGYIYREAGDFEKAMVDFNRAIELNPRNTDALASRGWVLQQQGELDGAKRNYEQALQSEPTAELKEKIERALSDIDPNYRGEEAYRADGAPALIDEAAPSVASADALDGTWTGSGHQTGGGGEPVSYPVVMRLSAGGGSIDYPSLNCGGSLTSLSAEGDAAQFKERITYGDCADGGTIEVKLNAGKLDWKWFGVADIVVTAQLASPCKVTDPTGTPLNVRDSPNGTITGTLSNGATVTIVESKVADNGKPWVKVVDAQTEKPIGWIFRDFVSCS
jgi:Flp pilus assembly protein TadD